MGWSKGGEKLGGCKGGGGMEEVGEGSRWQLEKKVNQKL